MPAPKAHQLRPSPQQAGVILPGNVSDLGPQVIGMPTSGQAMSSSQFMAGPQSLEHKRGPEDVRDDLETLAAAMKQKAELEKRKDQDQEEEEGDGDDALLKSESDEMQMYLDMFNNPKRRRKIEADLEPMNVQDIVLYRELRQKVKVSCGLEVTFRTVNGHESQAILDEVGHVSHDKAVSDLYLQEMLAYMNLAAGVRAVGSEVLPNHMDGRVLNKERFKEKLDHILDFPIQLLADLRVNYFWFDNRVKKTMIEEELGNG